jgi:hypothetical protein
MPTEQQNALQTSSFYSVCINMNRIAPTRNKDIYRVLEPVWIFPHSHFFTPSILPSSFITCSSWSQNSAFICSIDNKHIFNRLRTFLADSFSAARVQYNPGVWNADCQTKLLPQHLAHARENLLIRGAAVASGTFKINHRLSHIGITKCTADISCWCSLGYRFCKPSLNCNSLLRNFSTK